MIESTREANGNLGTIISQAGSMLVRQNLLLVCALVGAMLLIIQIGLGLTMQAQQRASKAELLLEDLSKQELRQEIAAARVEVRAMQDQLTQIHQQLDERATLKSNRAGQLQLEVPVETKTSAPSTEKVIIPLQQSKPSHTESR